MIGRADSNSDSSPWLPLVLAVVVGLAVVIALCLLVPWASTPADTELEVLTYELDVREGTDIVSYHIQLSTPAPGGGSGGGIQYTKDRYRSSWAGVAGNADFTTSGSANFGASQWRAVDAAVRSWIRAHRESESNRLMAARSEAVVPIPGLYLRVDSVSYGFMGDRQLHEFEVCGGAEKFPDVRPLIGSINRALPASVRQRYALPLPPASGR